MKKKRLHLPKLSLSKEIISSLSQEKVTGGITVTRVISCAPTCTLACQESQQGVSCIEVCPVTAQFCRKN
ncbi:class I lanthipeptide [Chitinophaga qingshengii]|uniref:Class I lanthipeptide n=1 Tax=Chitinophaga qingshengii TaxID=1569794 RepID=A0ABR7TST9_9BACT|nr:class I lanthipeptide [Chitinophaga qingshengii]MBC9933533.1 class I lanthipeptide [Chitinophaga qingshengii]